MKNDLTIKGLWFLAYEMHICERDIRNEEDVSYRNDSAIRMLCVARQIMRRFGKGWA